ncbi:MAG TPA: hypothetical protein VGH98_23325 [Gemmatimonadaceae bacterium]|jgi:hypothetical protein
MLEDEARRALIAEPRPPLVWEFGVLTDSWERPESSKPVLVGAEDGSDSSSTCYAVGYELAGEYQEELRPLWLAFLNWMSERHATDIYFFADQFWTEDQGWLEFGEAVRRRLVSGVTVPSKTSAGVYAARAHQVLLGDLLHRWWPTGLGMLGGASMKRGKGKRELESLMLRGRITSVDLTSLDWCFQTTATFDNLGFIVLSRNEDWAELRDALLRRGWVDGLPVDVALARL